MCRYVGVVYMCECMYVVCVCVCVCVCSVCVVHICVCVYVCLWYVCGVCGVCVETRKGSLRGKDSMGGRGNRIHMT